MAYRSHLPLWAMLMGSLAACGKTQAPPPVALERATLISRTDSRSAPDVAADAAFAAEARGSVAALVLTEAVAQDPLGQPILVSDPLHLDHQRSAGVELCRDERFAREPTAAFCSATLIAEDLVLTAGHCVLDQTECAETTVVFGYEASTSGAMQPLEASDIYGCSELLVMSSGSGSLPDYAVLRLDRPASGRAPARVARDARSLPLGFPIAVAGHPSGLPLKLTGDGAVAPLPSDYDGQEPEYFGADIDTFPGNSGSGAFFTGPGARRALVGILSASLTFARYRYDDQRDCDRYERWPSVTIWLTYAHQALSALCQVVAPASYPELCGCGDGSCAAAHEDGSVCATDCADACGDGLCLGSEAPASCAADCPTCGDGTCQATERCCQDCGCGAGLSCEAGTCVPDIEPGTGDGWTCEAPSELPPTSTQLEGSTSGALRRHTCDASGDGACYGPERYYTFTLAAPASLTARASGFAHIALALRDGACLQGSAFELAIDRAGAGATRLHRVLPAGTYELVVDGESLYDHGAYQLELDFDTPPMRDGDDCADPIELVASGAYVVSGDTSLAANDEGYGSSVLCGVSTFGNDHYYRFTLTEKTRVTAAVDAGHAASLVLREDACFGSLRCEAGPPELSRVLDPGTYMLLVDGEAHYDSGPYALSVEFETSPPLLGESCEDALPLTPSGEQRLTGTVLGTADDVDTPCDNGTSGDRVYTFTLSEPRTVRLEGTGDSDVRVDISASCPYTEGDTCLPLAATTRSFNQTLDPGTYFVVIDARTPGVGAYDIAIDFESEPAGESCTDAIPLALGTAPVSLTRTGHPRGSVSSVFYRFVLPEPSAVSFSAADPAQLQLSDFSRLVTGPTGELAMNTAPGSYCLQVYAPLGTPALQLSASATPLSAPDGRGCADAIPLAAPLDHALSGYVALGGSTSSHCTSDARRFYAFELAHATRVRAAVTSGFGLGLYEDPACTDLRLCSGSSGGSALSEVLEPGSYRLFVAGYPLLAYQLSIDFDCPSGADADEDGRCDAVDACPLIPGECPAPNDGGAPDAGGAPPDAEAPDATTVPPFADDDAGDEHDAGQDASVARSDASVPDASVAADGAVATAPDSAVIDPGGSIDAGLTRPGDAFDAGPIDHPRTRGTRSGCDCNVATSRAGTARAWLGLALAAFALSSRVRRRVRARR